MISTATRTAHLAALACALLACSTQCAVSNDREEPATAFQEFSLRKGKGVEVCEAYLGWLNRATYTKPPYCGRPEPLGVEGFETLHRVPLADDEVMQWLTKVWDFSNSNDQDRTAKLNEERRARGLAQEEPMMQLDGIRSALKSGEIVVWRYDPVDIDNDGVSDVLLFWQGFGASPGTFQCGAYYGRDKYRRRQQQLLLVVDGGAIRIDEERTRQLFEHPKSRGRPRAERFQPMGDYMGIVGFRGRYYFDAFLNPALGDAGGARKNEPELANTLGLFEQSAGETRQACEFLWNNHGSQWADQS